MTHSVTPAIQHHAREDFSSRFLRHFLYELRTFPLLVINACVAVYNWGGIILGAFFLFLLEQKLVYDTVGVSLKVSVMVEIIVRVAAIYFSVKYLTLWPMVAAYIFMVATFYRASAIYGIIALSALYGFFKNILI